MSRTKWALTMIIGGLLAYAAFGVLWLIGGGAGLVVLFMVSLRLHPRRGCSFCGGRGRFYSKLFPWVFRLCAHCGGNGRVLHPGIQYLGTDKQRRNLRRDVADRRAGRHYRERG